MRISLHTSPRDLERVVGRAVRMEETGFEALFLADSHLNALDPFQTVAVAARATSRLRFGTAVANVVFRDPTLLAGAAATASIVSGGRFVLGVGTGDGTTYRLGRRATRMADFERAVVEMRGLLRGGTVSGPMGEIGFQLRDVPPPPVVMAVEGPRGLELAGRIADGVLLGGGFEAATLDRALETIDRGAAAVGRSIDDLELVAAGMVSVDADPERARDRIRPRIANRAHHNFRHAIDGVPAEHRPEVERFLAAFDLTRPIDQRAPAHVIGPYLLDRFSITGTVEDVTARFRDLQERGIQHVLLTPHSDDFDATVELLAPLMASDIADRSPAHDGRGTP